MLALCVDIGNTSIAFGVFKEHKLSKLFSLNTDKNAECEYYKKKISILLIAEKYHAIAVSSVVPCCTQKVCEALFELFGTEPLIIDYKNSGLSMKIDFPQKAGSDRLCNIAGALFNGGGPVIVADLGTATTFSIADYNGDFLGGAILPGVQTSLTALSESASQLPQINLKDANIDNRLIGKNTEGAMLSGVINGTAAMLDGLFEKFSRELSGTDEAGEEYKKQPAKCYITGGYAEYILPFCNYPAEYEPNLLLKGMYRILLENLNAKDNALFNTTSLNNVATTNVLNCKTKDCNSFIDSQSVGFIGPGRVGTALGKWFYDNGSKIAGYYGRDYLKAEAAAQSTHSKAFNNLYDLVNESQIIFITVSDDAVSLIWQSIKCFDLSSKIVIHTSGTLSSSIFEGASERNVIALSMHPMQAFPVGGLLEKDTCFSLEGNEKAIKLFEHWLLCHDRKAIIIKEEQKPIYHLANVLVSNLILALFAEGVDIMMTLDISEKEAIEALIPLALRNLQNIQGKGFIDSLTGPVARLDCGTVRKHIKIIPSHLKKLYGVLSRRLLNITIQKSPERDAAEMSSIIDSLIADTNEVML